MSRGMWLTTFPLLSKLKLKTRLSKLAKDLIDDGMEVTTYDAPNIDVWDVSEEKE